MITTEIKSVYDKSQNLIGQTTTEKSYDSSGLQIHERQINSIGSIIMEREFVYANKLLTTIKEYNYGKLDTVKEFTYDDLGKLVQEVWTDADNTKVYESILKTNKDEIIEKEFDEKGNLILEVVKKLDKKGRVIKAIESEDYLVENKYEDGKLVNTSIYESGKLTLVENYFYDESGNEVGSKGVDYNENEEIIIEKDYNEVNKLIKEQQLLNGQLEFEKIVTYDSQYRISKVISSSSEESEITEFKYG